MRKKSIIVVLLVLLMSVVAFACAGGNKYKLDDYTDFTGGDNSLKLELDEDMKLDGIMDEEAWANVGNKMSVTSSHTHAGAEDKALKMDVYTHFGEKALYFAFDVTDNTIFVNPSRRQSRNTGVELYMSALDNFTFGKGCVSIRITPMENGTAPIIGYYVPSGAAGWFQSKAGGKYAAATMVDGQYNVRNGANGYVVELAISYDLIGGKTDAIQYTAAFVQALSADKEDRLDNTFLKGTSYVSPGGWIGVTETGTLVGDAKYDFLDSNYVTTDSYMNVDGKLDDEKWQELIAAGKGKTITHKGKDITLTTYALFGDNGVYIGLDSNDPEVWYNPDRQAKYNTGAEIFVTALGATELSNDSTVQIRFSVGGGSLRYRANPNAEYPYTQSYFPAKIAGSVKNGGEFNKSVTDDYAGVDGWQGEIFIPWTAFGATTEEQKSQIAVFNCIYYSRSDAQNPTGDQWKFLAPADSKVYGNGSRNVNPQKSFFRFTKADGFVFGGVEVPDVVFFKGNDGSYKATIKPRYVDAVTSADFATDTKLATGGTFSVTGIPTDSFTDNGDGTYTMTVSAENAKKFESGKEAHFSLAEGVGADFTIEYIDIDSSKFDVNKLIAYLNFDGTAKTTAGSAASSVTRGTAEFVKYGTGSANNGYYAANMIKSSVKLDATLGTDSFVMSAMVNGADVKNYFKNETTFGYSFVLFGTGNVDGTVGFSLQARRDNVFIRLPNGKRYSHAAVLDFVTDGWQRWTLSVDRETTDKLTYTLYIDAEKVATNTIDLASDLSFDIENNNTIGIGAPGCKLDGDGTGNGYTDKSVGIDEFVCATGAYSFGEILNMVAWTNEAHARYAFDADDIRFDYNDVTTDGYTQQIRVAAYREDGTTADVTDVTFGAEIAPYIAKATDADYFTLTIPANKVGEFKDGVTTTYTYNGATRKLTVKYDALERIYLDVTGVSAWKKNKVGDNYVFTVGVYGKSDLSAIVKGAEFSDWDSCKNDNGDGTYTFTVPASVVEALDAPKTITVTKGADVTSADFTFEYKYLTDDELAVLANVTEAYYDFNGNVDDKISGTDTAAVKGSIGYNDENTALKVSTNTNTVGAKIALGTESFTMSFDVKIYSQYFNGNAGYEFVTSGTPSVDAATDVFQISAHGGNQVLRIQVGDNFGKGGAYYNKSKGKLNLDGWVRITFVVERGLPCDDETLETVKTALYLDGVMVDGKTRTMPKEAILGNGTLYFGGVTPWTPGKESEIDNFTFVRKALTAKEVEALDSYYDEIAALAGWSVNDVEFNFTQVTDGVAFTAPVTFTTRGAADITGATFSGLPGNATITESTETPGTYALNVPAADIASFKGGVTVTAKIGKVEKKFRVVYTPLAKLVLDETSVSMWKGAKAADGNYKFNIGVYADDECKIALNGVTFDKWNDHQEYDEATSTYAFSVPAETVEALAEPITITASKGADVTTASFTFEYKCYTAAELEALANATEAYIDFDNGNVTDKVQNKAYVLDTREDANIVDGAKYEGDKYLAANQKKTSVKLATALGTDSFSVSMLVNGADVRKYALDDYLNGTSPKAGYAFVLFGTGNVDGTNGFSVRVRKDIIQVKIGSSNKGYSANVLSKITDNWQRWTVTFDRSTEGTVKYIVYIDGVAVINDSVAYDGSFDVEGFGTLGIGAPGCALDNNGNGYTDKSIGLDNFVLVRKALTAHEVEGLDSYYGDILKKVGWYVDNFTFDFTDVTENQAYNALINFTTNGSGANISGATFEGFPEGVIYEESQSAPGSYRVTIPYERFDEFKAGMTITAKIGNATRTFTVKYVPLTNVYLDTTAVSMWSHEATDGNYEFNVGAYADESKTFALTEVTFGDWNEYATYDTANKVYKFTVPASVVEALENGTKTVTAARGEGVETASFTFTHETMSAAQINELAQATKAYIDFNGAVIDRVGGNAFVDRGEVVYGDGTKYEGDKYYSANQKNTSVKLATTLGTDSFTVSMLVNGADIKNYAENGYAFVLFGTGNVDGANGFSVRVRSKTVQVKIGGSNAAYNEVVPAITTAWQRWTVTFDRSTEGTLKFAIYLDGVKVLDKTVAYAASFDVEGFGTLGIGAPGCALDSNGNGYTDKSIGLDEFMLVNRVLTAREIVALDSYYVAISDVWGWNANDITIKYDQVTVNVDKTVEFEMTKYASGANTVGATFTGLPEGVTIAAGETAGKYVLTVPYDKLASLKGGVTVTAKIGDVERSFKITYVPLDNLYVDTVNFYEYEVDAGAAVTRTIKVTADAAGAVGVAGASFAGYPDGVTIVENDSVTGEYTLTVPAAKIAELVASTVTASYDGVTANVKMTYGAAMFKDYAAHIVDNRDASTRVVFDKSFGTDSFVIGTNVMFSGIPAKNKTFELFGTSGPDATTGFMVSIKVNKDDANIHNFRVKVMNQDGAFSSNLNLNNYIGKSVPVVLAVDRSVAGKMTYTLTFDGTQIMSRTINLDSATVLDYTYLDADGATVTQNKVYFGGLNPNLDSSNRGGVGTVTGRDSFPYQVRGIYAATAGTVNGITDFLKGVSVTEADTTSVASKITARFNFDGETGLENSIEGSTVTASFDNARDGSAITATTDETYSINGNGKALKANSKKGEGLKLTGVNALDGDFTLSMWVNDLSSMGTSNTGAGVIMFTTSGQNETSNNFTLSAKSTNYRFAWANASNTAANNQSINPNLVANYGSRWVNMTFVVSRGTADTDVATVNVYVNFAKVGSFTAAGLTKVTSICDENKTLYLGRVMDSLYKTSAHEWNDGLNAYFYIDDVAIAGSALTDAEVASLSAYYFA